MALFRLFVDSTSGVDIDPEYDFMDAGKKIENVHRTKDGREYRYLWGEYTEIKFTVRFVDSSFTATVNSWWGANVDLKFLEVGVAGTERNVRIVNRDKPINKNIKPYRTLFQGTIQLGSF